VSGLVERSAEQTSALIAPGEALLSLVDLTCRFDELTAVRELNLAIAGSEFFSLIGPSGCGKTTTLRMIAGLEQPSSGRIKLGGKEITREPAFRRPVNTVFQHYALFPHLDVFENVAFGLRERRLPRQTIDVKVEEMLELVGLSGRTRARPRQLSGGQQQRVALARALVMEPQVLLLDEPLGALDLKLRKQMQRLLKRIQREVGITFVYVTHDQEEAFAMSDRVGVMNAGVLEQVGAPAEVYRRPATLFVADFVGASNRLEGTVAAQRDSGSYDVALDPGADSLAALGRPGLELGSRVALILRPEMAYLVRDFGQDALVRGEVRDVEYLGPQVIFRIDCGEQGEVTVAARGGEYEPQPDPGERVGVGWRPNSAWAVPAESDRPNERAFDVPRS
jgi:spermidine/putrescine transport system ATP-binding protein